MTFGDGRWAFTVTSGQDLTISLAEALCDIVRKRSAGLGHSLVDFQEEFLHLLGPALAILLPGSLEFAEVMSIAKAMLATETEIGFPVVVTQAPVEVL